MRREHPKVLIAGGGWRVSRFIVPALLNEGVARNDITILRRSSCAVAAPMLRSLRTVSNLDELDGVEFEVTLNCVVAESLVAVQQHLVQRYPQAVHFCDTPVFCDRDSLFQVLRLSRARIYSLEDWPLMPNLAFLVSEARRPHRSVDLRVEHFGILVHFLSLFRSLHGGLNPLGRRLTKRSADYIGEPRPGSRVTFRANKQLPLAKTSLRTDRVIIEDFHEVEDQPRSNDEVLYRLIDGTHVRYHRGAEEISAHKVDQSILDGFFPLDDRKNVHELDKFIGLARLFRSVLSDTDTAAYPYLSSARDSLTARRLGLSNTCWLI